MTYNRNNNNHNNNNHNNNRNGRVVLNIAEKPSVARALAAAFNRVPEAQDGGMRREAAQIFTHNNVRFPDIFTQAQQGRAVGPSAPHTMITTSVRGHLATTDFPEQYGWKSVDPIELFTAPLETIYKDDMKPLQTMLTRLSKNVHAVILWLDCDREGEAIADEVMQVCLESNPRLQPYVYRAKFSTVLDAEIRRALQTLGRLNDWFVQAVQARSQCDLRVGAAFTRFQTLRLQRKFQLSSGSVVSYGPCQFPTLGFVVERWARIETFVPEDFWFIELSLRIPSPTIPEQPEDAAATATATATARNNNNRPIHFSWKRNRLYDRVMTLALYEACLEAEVAVVTQLQGRPKNKWRPVPLATVELQKRASRYLRIGSETLMTAAEGLYQSGYISYPRTETERFRPEFQHRPLLQSFANMQGGGPFSGYVLFGTNAPMLHFLLLYLFVRVRLSLHYSSCIFLLTTVAMRTCYWTAAFKILARDNMMIKPIPPLHLAKQWIPKRFKIRLKGMFTNSSSSTIWHAARETLLEKRRPSQCKWTPRNSPLQDS